MLTPITFVIQYEVLIYAKIFFFHYQPSNSQMKISLSNTPMNKKIKKCGANSFGCHRWAK